MSLRVQGLFETIRDSFGAGASTSRFKRDFLTCVRRSLAQMNELGLIDYETISDENALIDGLDEQDEHVLAAGVTFHLVGLGHGSERLDKDKCEREWMNALSEYALKQSTAKDAGSEGVWGLGYQE